MTNKTEQNMLDLELIDVKQKLIFTDIIAIQKREKIFELFCTKCDATKWTNQAMA